MWLQCVEHIITDTLRVVATIIQRGCKSHSIIHPVITIHEHGVNLTPDITYVW